MEFNIKVDGEKNLVQAFNLNEIEIAKGYIIPTIPSDLYDYPRLDAYMNIEIGEIENKIEIKDQILDSLLKLGYKIKEENKDKRVRFYHCCFAHDIENLNYYKAKEGFKHDEGMYILRNSLEDISIEEVSQDILIKQIDMDKPSVVNKFIEKHKTVFRNSYSSEAIKELKENKGLVSIAALKDSEIVGNILVITEKNEEGTVGWIDDLFVCKGYRNKGISKALVSKALKYLQDINVTEAKLEVWGGNSRALGMYKHMGFELEKETECSIGMFL